jgi:hypothetical protein
VNNLIEAKIISKELVRPLGKNGQKPLTQTNFLVKTPGMMACWKFKFKY